MFSNRRADMCLSCQTSFFGHGHGRVDECGEREREREREFIGSLLTFGAFPRSCVTPSVGCVYACVHVSSAQATPDDFGLPY